MTVEWTSDAHLDVESPVMLVAFEGWNDAADVATGAVEHLALNWDARQIAEIGGDDYYNYVDQRPTVRYLAGVSSGVHWPSTTIATCRPEGIAHDIVLVRGPEPTLRWRRFASEFVDLVDTLEVTQVVLLGAYLADTPHTRPIPLSGVAFSRQRVATMGVRASEYEGPTGMPGVLQQLLTEAGIPALNIWAAIPHYVASPPNPQGTERVLSWLGELLGIEVPVDTLRSQAEQWAGRIDEAAQEDEDLADYIRSLEDRYDGVSDDEGEDPEPDRDAREGGSALRLIDGDALAAEFERYLRGDGEDR